MGLSDKLKQVGDKAKEAASQHRDQISQAVETAGAVADKRTRGKYTDKIAKATSKTEGMVERLAGEPEAETPAPSPPSQAETPAPSPLARPKRPPVAAKPGRHAPAGTPSRPRRDKRGLGLLDRGLKPKRVSGDIMVRSPNACDGRCPHESRTKPRLQARNAHAR